jgi:hypothetical protein
LQSDKPVTLASNCSKGSISKIQNFELHRSTRL